MSETKPHSLSIVVMTFNEEKNIERCLSSVEGLGEEIVVLDSYSNDRTIEIAQKMGAHVEQFPFDSYINQKNRLIQLAEYDWVLAIDADEYLSPELKSSILSAKSDDAYDAYTSNRRNKIGNTWMKHGTWYPDKKIRFFDRRKISITGKDPHDVMLPLANARVGHLLGDIMHDADANISSRYQTIEKHSTHAAEALFDNGQKWKLWRMIFKPLARFLVAYFIRLGFLDGYYGWIIARSEVHYVWLREAKLWEMWKEKTDKK